MRIQKYLVPLSFLTLISITLLSCFHEAENDNTGGNVIRDIIEIPDTSVTRKTKVLHKSADCLEFKSYLAQNLIEQYLDNQNHYWGFCPFCGGVGLAEDTGFDTAVPTAGGATSADTNTQNPGDVTGTNNQEAGVDELDTVKTDASGNIYLVQDDSFYIFDAFPPESLSVLAKLSLDGNAIGLFIDENNKRAIVLTQEWVAISYNTGIDASLAYYPYFNAETIKIHFIDISNLTAPVVDKIVELDGSYEAARFIGDRVHLVLNHYLRNIDESFATRQFHEDLDRYWQAKYLNFESLQADIAALRAQLAQQIVDGVGALDLTSVIPSMKINTNLSQGLLACGEIFHPEVSLKTAGLISVSSVDSDGDNFSSVGAFASGGIVYATQEHLYLAQMSSGWWWNSVDQESVIHKFALGNGSPSYLASGAISGLINDQFSFSEYQDHLRIATSERRWPADSSQVEEYNHLFVLAENDGLLEVVGSVEKFAPGERIFSARYLGDRGFVVTFRQTDPLFAFDLSDPTNPLIAGELKIPGFSTYMHPIDENHLLTIGKAGTTQGATQEIQLQIFDISDLSNPTQIASHIPKLVEDHSAWVYSLAESDHHAFTFATASNILAIPLSFYDWNTNDSFAGIATFNIDINSGITENGSVDHSDFVTSTECGKYDSEIGISYDVPCIDRYYTWSVQPNRSVIMQDSTGNSNILYSISRLGIKANNLSAMETTLGKIAILP